MRVIYIKVHIYEGNIYKGNIYIYIYIYIYISAVKKAYNLVTLHLIVKNIVRKKTFFFFCLKLSMILGMIKRI